MPAKGGKALHVSSLPAFRYNALIGNGRNSVIFRSEEEYVVGDVIQLPRGGFWRIYGLDIDEDGASLLYCTPTRAALELVEA